MRARLGQPGQALTGTHKQRNAQFFFQFANLPAHAGLRGVKRAGHIGEVEVASHGFTHGAQLLKVHGVVCQAHGIRFKAQDCGCTSLFVERLFSWF